MVLEKVQNTIKKYNLLKKGDSILIAISGGADSVCLTYILWQLKKKYGLELRLIHFRHGLRSKKREDKEEKLIKNLAKGFRLPLTVKKINVSEYAKKNKLTIEEAGRNLRYQYLIDYAIKNDFDKIATGHNLDDQAETVLLNLLRGSGLPGLRGIPIIRQEKGLPSRSASAKQGIGIIRPLLGISRKEILQYVKGKSLPFSVDETNISFSYTRNRIRHELLPLLEKYNPRVKEHLAHLAEIVREEEVKQEGKVKKIIPRLITRKGEKIILDLKKFLCYNKISQDRIIDYLLESWGRKSFVHFTSLKELIAEKKTGKSIDLGRGWRAEKVDSKIYFVKSV